MALAVVGACLALPPTATGWRPRDEPYTLTRVQLRDQLWREGATFADLNTDGVHDIVSGPWSWEGPDLTRRHSSGGESGP